MDVATLGGEIRSVSPSALVRTLRIATGVEALSLCLRHLGRLLLRVQRYGEVHIDGSALHIVERRSMFGRALAERRTLVPAQNLASISVFDRRAELTQSAGLGALAAGTLLGAGLFTQGLRTTGFAPSLLALGLALATIGGALDFALDRLALRRQAQAARTVRIVPLRGKAFVLSGMPAEAAEAWLERAKALLEPSAC